MTTIPTLRRRTVASRHGGFTIVEIMVALVISLVLIGGVIQIFISSRGSYSMQAGLGRLQENARFVIGQFNNEISRAGYGISNIAIGQSLQLAGTPLDAAADGPYEGTGSNPDSIEISYVSGTDCLNQATPAGIAINKYSINASNELQCLGNGGNTAQPLVNGVENMQVLFGVDTTGDKIPNFYINATEVTNLGQWSNVVAVRMAFLFDTVDKVDNGYDTGQYVLLDAPPINAPANDMLRRRVYTRTFLVRNNLYRIK